MRKMFTVQNKAKGLIFVIIVFMCGGINMAFGNEEEDVLFAYKKALLINENYSGKINVDRTVLDFPDVSEIGNRYVDTFVYNRYKDKTEWIGSSVSYGNNNIAGDEIELIRIINNSDYVYLDGIKREEYNNNYSATITRVPAEKTSRQKGLICDPILGGPIFGYFFGSDYKNMYELLKEGTPAKEGEEVINTIPCIRVRTKNKYGTTTAWIAPSKGYNAVKWTIEKTPSDYFNSQTLANEECKSWLATFTAEDFLEIEGHTIVSSATFRHTRELSNGKKIDALYKYKCENINISPKFEGTDVFKTRLPENTRVFIMEFPGISYIWQSNKLLPYVDQGYLNSLNGHVDTIVGSIVPPSSSISSIHASTDGNVMPSTNSTLSSKSDKTGHKPNRSIFKWISIVIAASVLFCIATYTFYRKGRR
jgi:hypothetical protein